MSMLKQQVEWSFRGRMPRVAVQHVAAQLIAVASMLGFTGIGLAQLSYQWIEAAGGVYHDPENWSPSGPPGANDHAVFDLDANYLVSILSAAEETRVSSTAISAGSMTLNVWPSHPYVPDQLTVTGPSTRFTIGGASRVRANTVRVTEGGTLVLGDYSSTLEGELAVIGDESGSSGAVVVDFETRWLNSGQLQIGGSGEGTLTIGGLGFVQSGIGRIGAHSGSSGTVTVAGRPSRGATTWLNEQELRVGDEGTGILTIHQYAAVSSPLGRIGVAPGSSGIVTVSGTAEWPWVSTWVSGEELRVGEGGSGSLNVLDGGWVEGAVGRIGVEQGATGVVTVSGASSGWLIGDELRVGERGAGTLTIADQGMVRIVHGPGILDLAVEAPSQGTLRIGDGTLLVKGIRGGLGSATVVFEHNQGNRIFSTPLSGRLMLEHAGTGTTVLTAESRFAGGIKVSGGTLVVGGGWGGGGGSAGMVELSGDVSLSGGVLRLEGAGRLQADSISAEGDGAFQFVGGMLRVEVFEGNLVNAGGTLAPGGLIAGSTTIIGDYDQQSTGRLEIKIAGVGGGQHDTVLVDGTATLSGRIGLLLSDGFVPAIGDEFEILRTDINDVVGTFDAVDGSLPRPGIGMAVIYEPRP